MSEAVAVSSPDRLRQAVHDGEAAGCDELILVPGTTDPRCLEAATEVVASL